VFYTSKSNGYFRFDNMCDKKRIEGEEAMALSHGQYF
jgi:hypothetical protein